MKKTYYIILAAAALLSAVTVCGQTADYTTPSSAEKIGDRLLIKTSIDMGHMNMHRQGMAEVTPVLRSADGTHTHRFAPTWILGKTRNKALRRAEALDGFMPDPIPADIHIYHRGDNPTLPLTLDADYEPWMRTAELRFEEKISGCAGRPVAENDYGVIEQLMTPAAAPAYGVSFIVPEVEQVKLRSETYEAHINFRVNGYEIMRSYMQNAAELDKVDAVVREVVSDPLLTLKEIKVVGYASPDGSAQGNMTLSERRAKSFANYIRGNHKLDARIITTDWRGDDWGGLIKLMHDSPSFAERDRVIDIVNNTANVQSRKNALKALGAPYQTLLKEYYPQLRRNEYTVSYVARPFTIDEAREIIHTNPQYLSIDEMHRVANSYPKGSKEYNEAYAIAARTYGDNDIVMVNNSAIQIENGNWDGAIATLAGVDTPAAWNNTGYAYIQKQDYARAAEYFRRAADSGNAEGKKNLALLQAWQAER